MVGIITGGDLLDRGDLGLRLSIKQELELGGLRERLQALAHSPRSAHDVMSRHVHAVAGSTDLATVIRLMAAHRLKRLPVVNERKELIGIVSRADVLRAIAALPEPAGTDVHEIPAAAGRVADAVITGVPVLAPDTGAEEVLERVLASPFRRAVVAASDGTVLGLVSDRDILARSSPETRPWILRMLTGQGVRTAAKHDAHHGEALTASDLMAPSLIAVHPEDSLAHAIRLMMQHRVKRLVVVDQEGRLVGLVDRREILRLLAGDSDARDDARGARL